MRRAASSVCTAGAWAKPSPPASNGVSHREGEGMGHGGLFFGGRMEFCSKTVLKNPFSANKVVSSLQAVEALSRCWRWAACNYSFIAKLCNHLGRGKKP